jgi:hypothetical protein
VVLEVDEGLGILLVLLEVGIEVLELLLGVDPDPVVEELERDPLMRSAQCDDFVDVVVGLPSGRGICAAPLAYPMLWGWSGGSQSN